MTVSRLSAPKISDATAFGRVVVLMGGLSSEREISLMTGEAVLAALRQRGVNAQPLDVGDDVVTDLKQGNYDRAWVALHGLGGEDGMIQGVLEYLAIPYTGSGILGSALSMDKLRSKRLFTAAGLGTPSYRQIGGEADFATTLEDLGLPLITKPAGSGSSLGLSKVERAEDLAAAYLDAARLDDSVFAEAWIRGPEYSASILDDVALPLIHIETPNTFYDYEAKYFTDTTRYHCPSGLSDADELKFGQVALRAFKLVAAEGWGRVDFIVDDSSEALVLEVNTVPGMTSHSLVPMAASEMGVDFDELVWRILETSLAAKRYSLHRSSGGDQ